MFQVTNASFRHGINFQVLILLWLKIFLRSPYSCGSRRKKFYIPLKIHDWRKIVMN